MFNFKTINNNKKWQLEPSKESSLFLNAVQPNKNKTKRNPRVNFSVEEKDNRHNVENVYKIRGESQKIVKNDNKKDNNIYEEDFYSDASNNDRQNNKEDYNYSNNYTNKREKKARSKFDSGDRVYHLAFSGDRDRYHKRRNMSIDSRKLEPKHMKKMKEIAYEYANIKEFKRRNRKGYTYTAREPASDDEAKNIKKVKTVKAKIKKFTAKNERSDIYYYEPTNKRNPKEFFNYLNEGNNRTYLHSHKISDKQLRKMNKSNSDKGNNKKDRSNNSLLSDSDSIEDEEEEEDESEEFNIRKSRTISANKKNNNKAIIKRFEDKSKKPNKPLPTRNPINNIMKVKLNKTINTDRKKVNEPNLNKTQYKIPLKTGGYPLRNFKTKPTQKKENRHNKVNSVTIFNPSYYKTKVNPFKDLGIDAIKSKFKIKLIAMNDRLLDAIHYYNGPIDISCISCKKYEDAIEDLTKKVSKNGYKCVKSRKNYFEFANGLHTFLVEIVKIRNNMLYYLVLKDK